MSYQIWVRIKRRINPCRSTYDERGYQSRSWRAFCTANPDFKPKAIRRRVIRE
jgi:hypothetical protein